MWNSDKILYGIKFEAIVDLRNGYTRRYKQRRFDIHTDWGRLYKEVYKIEMICPTIQVFRFLQDVFSLVQFFHF